MFSLICVPVLYDIHIAYLFLTTQNYINHLLIFYFKGLLDMIQMPVADMKKKIIEQAGLDSQQLNEKVRQKMEALSGLISEDGALHIIANELGINLFGNLSGKLQIKNILAGMRSVETAGKVIKVFPLREFQSNGRSGKVTNITIGDETGTIKVVGWGSKADELSVLNDGDIIRIKYGYVKDNLGRNEIHLNDKSDILVNPDGISITDVASSRGSFSRKNIVDLNENDFSVELLGTIVQVFEPRFYEVCPDCGKRVKLVDGLYSCEVHKEVAPAYSYVVNLSLDDGTDSVRVVCFKNATNSLFNMSEQEIAAMKDSPDSFKTIQSALIGTIAKFSGRVNKNTFFNRLEFVANTVDLSPDAEAEIKRLNEEIQNAGSVQETSEEEIIN